MIATENTWILDSLMYKYTNALLQEFFVDLQKRLETEGTLDIFIVDLIIPHLDQYMELSANTSNNPLESNTKQLIAKDWLLDQIKQSILVRKF